jgi:hypothetical protein
MSQERVDRDYNIQLTEQIVFMPQEVVEEVTVPQHQQVVVHQLVEMDVMVLLVKTQPQTQVQVVVEVEHFRMVEMAPTV